MIKRKIGPFEVNPIGLGCMGLSAFYGPPTDHADAVRLLRQAVDLGVDHFDTAELYGRNEELLGEALEGLRGKIRIATKFGPKIQFDENGKRVGQTIDGSPANMRRAVENSLRYLRTDHIDLYYLHRLDRRVPERDRGGQRHSGEILDVTGHRDGVTRRQTQLDHRCRFADRIRRLRRGIADPIA